MATRPRWRDLATELEDAIGRGEYQPGDRLPSVRDLMASHEVSDSTVLRAFRHLVEERRVVAEERAGYRVAGAPRGAVTKRLDDHERRLDRLERHVGLGEEGA